MGLVLELQDSHQKPRVDVVMRQKAAAQNGVRQGFMAGGKSEAIQRGSEIKRRLHWPHGLAIE